LKPVLPDENIILGFHETLLQQLIASLWLRLSLLLFVSKIVTHIFRA